ncbi:hypothetical protein EMCRGX_G031388 [Ephydatia muelleri]
MTTILGQAAASVSWVTPSLVKETHLATPNPYNFVERIEVTVEDLNHNRSQEIGCKHGYNSMSTLDVTNCQLKNNTKGVVLLKSVISRSCGGYKGIPNGLKQSRPAQCRPIERHYAKSIKKRRVYYGQMKTFRCMANQGDDDDSIVKHKLATTAVREKPSTSAARVVEARGRLPRGLC